MLTIPNSVTSIGHRAFYYCGGFTGPLTLPNSVTTIGNEAFHGCTGFTGSLTIGTGVISIGQGAFRYCAGFTSMTVYPQTPPTLGSEVFFYVPTTIPVYVLCSSMEDYQAASQWSAFTNMQCIQETLTVYDGTVTNNHIPAYIYYFDEYTKSQFVIPAANLADMTGTPISSMTFYTKGSNVPYTTVSSADVYLKEVNYTNINAFEPKASATTVYSGYLDIVSTDSGGEMTINFSTPYTYNGGNLLVGFENTEASEWKEISFYGKTVSGASVSGSNTSSLGSVQPTQQNFIPKTTFSYAPFACSRPISLAASKITSNSAMLQWTGYQDEYDLRYRKTDEWVLALSTNNQLLIDNLEPGTEYEWQVRGRDCEGSGTYTEWSATHSFTTKCVPLFVNAGNPFIEDFEGEDFAPACWENIPSGTYQWANATYQSHSSSHSAFSSWYGDIYLVLPDLELSADAESVQLSFWSYNIYPTDFAEGNNTVVLLNGNIETVLWSADEVSESWVKTTIDLTAYLGQTVSLAFKYAGDNGNGWFVDDVEVSVPVSTHWPDFNAEDYTFASQVFAFVQINEDYITEDNYEDKEIAAFVGDECRGHAYMYVFNYGDPYTIVELGICYDNSGEEVSFKLYDHAARREYDVCTPSFPVLTGEDHFELFFDDEEDLVLSFVSSNIQAIELSAGWNWISTCIEVEDPIEMLQAVEAGLGENGLMIKSSQVNTEYDSEWGWFGDLDDVGMTNEQMYAINVNAPCTLTVEGTPANPEDHTITINQGWNWIGFPSGVAISLEDAFDGFAQEGDKIKSSNAQIEYDPEWGWWGDFEMLEPGQGYMYYSASSTPRTLLFPEGAK
jgi:hypothetical protein